MRRSAVTFALIVGAGAMVVGAAIWLSRESMPDEPAADPVADFAGDGALYEPLAEPARVLDTRVGQSTLDGRFAGTGIIGLGTTLELPIAGRSGHPRETSLVGLAVTVTAGPDASELLIESCGSVVPAIPSLRVESWATVTDHLLVPLAEAGDLCLTATAPVDVVVHVEGFFDDGLVAPLATPITLVDTAPDGSTVDGTLAGIGVRPAPSTLRVPVDDRSDELADVGAVVVRISTEAALDAGEARVFAAESTSPIEPTAPYAAGSSVVSTVVANLGSSGLLCVSTSGRTDLVVDVVATVPAASVARIEGSGDCPGRQLFPDVRVVALYGTARSARLGVLGEQDPAAAAARLEAIAEPWRAGDRPVLPAFELIATLATGTPEERGDYNIRASPDFVQAYLDVARRHGYYLILDIQPGRSDFLTEAKYYESFLRQPDVGIALDPEWRVQAPDVPQGGSIGSVDAAEINAVIDYVADLVAEHDLPEKLVVVHQFQDAMVTNKAQLVEQPGVALTIHMDGFGTVADKLDSWDVVRVEPPLHMGLKLFYDEDIGLLSAEDVLAGLFEPVPDVITYQ